MRRKKHYLQEHEETAFGRMLGPTPGMQDQEPPLSSKMSIEDAYIDFHLRVYSRHKLIFEFKKASIYECFLRKKEVPHAARKLNEYLAFLRDIGIERFIKATHSIFGWSLGRGRPRQKHVIILVPDGPAGSTVTPDESAPTPHPDEPQI